jgi:hypothetical protein
MASPKNPHYDGFYTVREASVVLDCDEKTVRNLVDRGKIRKLVDLRPARLCIGDVDGLLKLSTKKR